MSMNDADAARQMNGKLSWQARRETVLEAFGLWEYYGPIPPYNKRDAHHREWLPGGSER